MNIIVRNYSIDNLAVIVEQIYLLLKQCNIITFSGTLGAGKTTLIQALLRRCGIEENVVSPTFSYLNTYINKEGQKFNHFDLYRLNSKADFLEAGFDEYLSFSMGYALIEWPELIKDILPSNQACHVLLDYVNENKRKITIFTRCDY